MARNISLLILVLVLVAIGYFEFRTFERDQDAVNEDREELYETPELETYASSTLGFQFRYPSGARGYTLNRHGGEATDTRGPLETLVLLHAEDDGEAPIGDEGPPTITIQVFENELKQWPATWAEANARYSSANLMFGDAREVVVGGANAIRYRADGLYAQEVVVIAHGSYIYLVSAGFIDETSPTLRDLEAVLESFTFIPEEGTE